MTVFKDAALKRSNKRVLASKTKEVSVILDCGHVASPCSSITNGYGTDASGKRHCYTCIAEMDKKYMRDNGKIMLYLTENTNTSPCVTNWPGSLKINVFTLKKGRHNIAGSRYDVRFYFEGKLWHGVQYGDNTQIWHCKQTKKGTYP